MTAVPGKKAGESRVARPGSRDLAHPGRRLRPYCRRRRRRRPSLDRGGHSTRVVKSIVRKKWCLRASVNAALPSEPRASMEKGQRFSMVAVATASIGRGSGTLVLVERGRTRSLCDGVEEGVRRSRQTALEGVRGLLV